MRNTSIFVAEPLSRGVTSFFAVERLLAVGDTPSQSHQIVDLRGFGRALLLNGRVHRCQLDGATHHEILAHPALITHPNPKRVLILGGGAGGVLREVLRHPGVERVVLLEPDPALVHHARKHLPDWSSGAFEDPRTRLIHSEVRTWLQAPGEAPFDVIIADLPEPLDGGPAARAFTREAFEAVNALLASDGIFACGAGPAALTRPDLLAAIRATAKAVFPIVRTATVLLTTTLEPRAVVLASKKLDPTALDEAAVAERMEARSLFTRRYTARLHPALFEEPAWLVERATRVLEDAEPFSPA